MGALSSELRLVKGYLDKALKSINSKYKAIGLPEQSSMTVSQLPDFIDKIKVVNTTDEAISVDAILCEECATIDVTEGWHNKGNVRIQTQEKTGFPAQHLTIIEPDDNHVLSRVFIEGDANLTPGNIKEGVTIFGVTGELKDPKIQEKTGTPSAKMVVVTPDNDDYLLSRVFIEGDEDLIPENIKKGVTIFGVTGDLEADTQEKTVTPSAQPIIVEPDQDYLLSKVTVEGDEDLISSNIREGVTIFGVAGSLKAESDFYNIVYVVNLEKHIAYKQEIKYDETFNIINTIPSHPNAVMDFMGWSASHTATTATYKPGEAINTNLAGKGKVAILYAVWHENQIPTAPTMTFTYNNNGRIVESTGTETGNITITPGVDPEAGTVTTTLQCVSENASDVELTKLSETVYNVIYKQPSIYVFMATTTDEKGLSNSCAGTSIIYGSDGAFAGTGTFEIVGEDGAFTSDISDKIKGCYISKVTLKVKVGSGHSNSSDRVDFTLYDSNGNNKVITAFSGNFGSSENKITKNFTVSDDVRQIQFYAVTPGHDHCISENSTISWDIEYAFDIDLYNKEK